ncbi:ubiquitin-conjugating enzyme E2 T-like [Diadema antillarum]|uniref:ubiquitin-conjugating enzyme E2 T-like n=1 Tax=Diadema antillarum TaxID=105358 RepID=UPI003A884CCB
MQRVSRMKRELAMLEKEPPPGISCWAKADNVTQLEAQIVGGDATPYAGGVFKLEIQIPERYPFEPPKVQYVTPIYHPNIDTSGRICLDLLKMPPAGNWKPSLNISTVLTSLQLLMAEPNPDDSLMVDISTEFKHNRPLFSQKAKEWTKKHATPSTVALVSANKARTSDDTSDSSEDSSSDDSDEEEETAKLVKRDSLTSRVSNRENGQHVSTLANSRPFCKDASSRGSEATNERRGEKRCLQEANGEPGLVKRSHVQIDI